ncbi:MAG: type II secretion system F family protein [Candidatus Gracilibacteria bacterium]|nr:type II secretion system F family protein [Candidatus Gracilibacteria bacterium]
MDNQSSKLINFTYQISWKDKILLYEHLSNLLEGGVTILVALESFIEKTSNPKIREEIGGLFLLVNSGDQVSLAMKKMPNIFDKREISIIEAGENSGTIQKSFLSLAEDLRKKEELKTKVKSSLTYPFIIMCFLLIAITIVMYYVIPKFQPIFETVGANMPFATQSLINTSNFVVGNFGLIIFLIFLGAISFKIFTMSDFGKYFIDDLKLKTPLIGPVYKNYILSNIASSLGLLLGAGIDIIKSLKLTAESSDNEVYKLLIYEIGAQVSSGKKISESIEEIDSEHKFFKSDFIQMLNAGEKTSTLNKIFQKLFVQYTREVDNSLSIFIKWIEPIVILIASIFVLWFALAILSVVLQMSNLNF